MDDEWRSDGTCCCSIINGRHVSLSANEDILYILTSSSHFGPLVKSSVPKYPAVMICDTKYALLKGLMEQSYDGVEAMNSFLDHSPAYSQHTKLVN